MFVSFPRLTQTWPWPLESGPSESSFGWKPEGRHIFVRFHLLFIGESYSMLDLFLKQPPLFVFLDGHAGDPVTPQQRSYPEIHLEDTPTNVDMDSSTC